MIHPINIPEELFAVNPRRPKLLLSNNDKPRKKLSYTNDGRKMVDDVIKSPLSPNSIWRETFLRTFIRRLSLSKVNPTTKIIDKQKTPITTNEEDNISRTSISIETCDMIDIVDLEPKNKYKSESDENNITTVILEDEEILKNCCPVDYDAICPILVDCCQNIIDTNGDRKYQEFLRCDFSNINKNPLFCQEYKEKNDNSKDGRKNSIDFLPSPVGNRIWLEEESCNCGYDSQIKFNIQQIHKNDDIISIEVHIINGNDIDILFKTLLHVHIKENNGNDTRASVSENIHILKKHDDRYIKIWISINDLIREALEDDNKCLLLIVMAKLEMINHVVE
ncbi:Hypothetical protein SRAE_2000131800 [Strongyloides ratti]|uniref:Uncharacterized protein n=1 Tax=Strongyloides ratti TaxID=34506 RepID=A0A090LGK9_STRRB|nr:Hypothetical protein SRAE_2000131800 [Strongyloides ratti]CEF66650.1 Hypothetical protein SRAE_2000131800 [Strongyloides ratti]